MTESKLILLDSILNDLKSFVIAFSGGLDSSFLVFRAHSLKNLKFKAAIIRTSFITKREINEALEFSNTYGIVPEIIDVSFPDAIKPNPLDRCYVCKKILFSEISGFARTNGFKNIIDGTNADDKNDYRPGLRALSEMNIKSPLAEAGLTKKDIRELAHKAGLSIWDKPAMACLLTRIPYDTEISEGMLRMIEKAEDFLFEKGFHGTRVRMHGDIARIECIPGYLTKLVNDPRKDLIISYFKDIGFRYIAIDLEGYRTGSMNPKNLEI